MAGAHALTEVSHQGSTPQSMQASIPTKGELIHHLKENMRGEDMRARALRGKY